MTSKIILDPRSKQHQHANPKLEEHVISSWLGIPIYLSVLFLSYLDWVWDAFQQLVPKSDTHKRKKGKKTHSHNIATNNASTNARDPDWAMRREREKEKEFTLRFDLIRKQENGVEEDKEKKVKPIKKTHLLLYGINCVSELGDNSLYILGTWEEGTFLSRD